MFSQISMTPGRPATVLLWIPILLATPLPDTEAKTSLRVASYNASLYGKAAGDVRSRLGDGMDTQAEKVAAIVQTVRPDILLINEIDYDANGVTAKWLAKKFFGISQREHEPIDYPFVFAVPSNTGIDSKLDLNRNGVTGEPSDAWGYGAYGGQYSMAIYSRYPIDVKAIRTFQRFLWKNLPGALRPIDPESRQPYYDDAVWNALRLSSKNHVDVPIMIEGERLHLLASHPTPPVFDGTEDRNGCRNHDEIRFWIDYLKGPRRRHLVDDKGNAGGLPEGALFVVLGDLNSDPSDGDSRREAIRALLNHPRLRDPMPSSKAGSSDLDTAHFGRHGSLRVDYVLPSRSLRLTRAGVFWPRRGEDGFPWVSASDHRMVWIEVEIP